MILGDGSDETRRLVEREWRPAPPLAEPDRTLWGALGGGAPAFACGLAPRGFFRLLLVGDAPRSQFDVLHGLLSEDLDLPGPVACVALTGRGFHGHRGRAWAAPPGNLHLSAAFVPSDFAARDALSFVMLPAVAAVDAMRAGGLHPGIKWVNDVLISGRKVAGVLTATQSQGERLSGAVLGIGLNVERPPDIEPTPFVPAAGCLSDVAGGEGLTLSGMLTRTLNALSARYETLLREGPGSLFAAYREASLVLGREVRIWPEGLGAEPAAWPPPIASGTVRDLLPDLSLVVGNRPESVGKGRLAFEEICREFGL